jgi:hypothetical protein
VPIHLLSRRWFLPAAFMFLMPAARAAGQGTAPVAPSDPVYRDVDRLAQLGLLDSVILGQRPYSRRELARITKLARTRLGAAPDDVARRGEAASIVNRLAGRFSSAGDSLIGSNRLMLLDGAALRAVSTDADRRGFAGTFPAKLEATIDPLALPRRIGPPAPRGESGSLELAQRAEPTRWLSLDARERFELALPRPEGGADYNSNLLLGGVRARVRNLALSVGREQLAWATSDEEGLFLSADAPALDQLSLAADGPFLLPGFLRALGPTQATLLLADLGRSEVRSHSRLLAYKVSVRPHRSLELGASFMNHFGGAGAPSAPFGDRLIDFLPFVDIFRRHNYTDPTRPMDVESDKLLGVDGRLRLARLGGLTLATELLIDDFDVHRIPTLFGWDGSQTFSALLPSVAGSAYSLRLSAAHTGVRTYTHGPLSNGITTRGILLGDELGPDAKAFDAAVTWHGQQGARVALAGRTELYSRSDYVIENIGTRFDLHREGTVTNELRDRVVASVEFPQSRGFTMIARAGAERIRNADFASGRRHSYRLDVAMRLDR